MISDSAVKMDLQDHITAVDTGIAFSYNYKVKKNEVRGVWDAVYLWHN